MLKNPPIRYVFLGGLLLAFFLDGSLAYNLAAWFYNSYSMVPCLSLLWLVLTLFFANDYDLHLEIWSAVAGACFDLYYTGIWGTLVLIFPLLIYVSKLLYRSLPVNFGSDLVIYGVDLILLLILGSVVNHFVSRLSGITVDSGVNFVWSDAVPTILLNLVLFSVLYFPVQFLYSYYQKHNG